MSDLILIVNPDNYVGDPEALAATLGDLPLALSIPDQIESPDANTPVGAQAIRDGTYTRAVLQQLYDELPAGWFVIQVHATAFATYYFTGLGIPLTQYPAVAGSDFSSGTHVTDSGVVYPNSPPFTGDASYTISSGTLRRTTNTATSLVLIDVGACRGQLGAGFTVLPTSGSAVIFHYISATEFWRFRYTGSGWIIEHLVDSTVIYSGNVIGDTTPGSAGVVLTGDGAIAVAPNGDQEFAPAIDTSQVMGLLLQGNGTTAAQADGFAFVPEFTIGYWQPANSTEAADIAADTGGDLDAAVAEAATGTGYSSGNTVSSTGFGSTRTSHPLSQLPSSSAPGDVGSAGLVTDYDVSLKYGRKPPAPQSADISHVHDRQNDLSPFTPDSTFGPASGHGRQFNIQIGQILYSLTADQNDWNPDGIETCSGIMITPTGNYKITGIGHADAFGDPTVHLAGSIIWLHNVSDTYSITLTNDDAASVSVARFHLPNNEDVVIPPLGIATVQYEDSFFTSGALDGWMLVSTHVVVNGTDIQRFSASGTWTRPSDKTWTKMICIAAGGGGGSGRRGAAATVRCGGGGGSSGGYSIMEYLTSDLPSTLSVTVNAAGAGGAAITTNNTNGAVGGTAQSTYVGSLTSPQPLYCRARGGVGGAGGTATSGTGGITQTAGYTFIGASGQDADPTGAFGGSGGATSEYGVGGSAGGGITVADAVSNGGAGVGSAKSTNTNSTLGGIAPGGNGVDGTNNTATNNSPGNWLAGSGGAASKTGAAGHGGAGGQGQGGGGGGASLNGNASGAGGDGGPGVCFIISW